jgi:hypothetical protein
MSTIERRKLGLAEHLSEEQVAVLERPAEDGARVPLRCQSSPPIRGRTAAQRA